MSTPSLYPVKATDADGDVLTYSLVTAPAGMTISATTGLVRWTPASAGTATVTVRVADPYGRAAEQTYALTVAATPLNRPPLITSAPDLTAVESHLYSYDVEACDPEGQALTFGLTQAPSGMTIDPATGLLQWTPPVGTASPQTVLVTATDSGGATGWQRFLLAIRANQAPTITSTPPGTVTGGLLYRYDVRATDPENDALTYQLLSGPAGMTLDANGRVTWQTTHALVSATPYAAQVQVTDTRAEKRVFR